MLVLSHSPVPFSGGSNVTTGSVRCAASVVSGATERLNWTRICALRGTSVSPSPGMTCCTASCPPTVNFFVVAVGTPASMFCGTVTVYVAPRSSPGKSGWKRTVRSVSQA